MSKIKKKKNNWKLDWGGCTKNALKNQRPIYFNLCDHIVQNLKIM